MPAPRGHAVQSAQEAYRLTGPPARAPRSRPDLPPASLRNETACRLIDQSVRIRPPKFGAVVQLVRIPACHAGGRGFESRPLRQIFQRASLIMLQRIGDALKGATGHRWLGYRVSEDALREAVHSEQAFQVGGQYSPEAAKAALAQAGISLQAYEEDLRTSVQRAQLEGGIRASDFLTPLELTRLTDLEDQEREVRYLVLPVDRFKPAAGVDEAAVQAYYQAHQGQYMTPESARLQYAELRLEALAAQQSVSDADLHAAYEKNKSRLDVPEKRHGRHILITGKDDAAALAQAQQVLAQAKAGKDFGDLAKQYSQDPGSAKDGGGL